MPLQNKDDGTGTSGGTNAPDSAAGMLYLGGTPDQIMSAMAAAVLDEINTLRTNGVLGLAAITPTAWVAKIAAKKT